MQKVRYHLVNWPNAAFILIGILVALADQFSKAWIRASIPEGHSLFELGFFRITHVQNTGAAFGLFQGQNAILTIVAFLGIVIVFVLVFLFQRYLPFINTMLGKSVFGLVLGGIAGNLIDRLTMGYITDFIAFTFWPTFNIADSAMTVSLLIFACLLIREAITEKG